MSQKVDALFGEDESSVRPKIRTIVGLLISGSVLAFLGLACSSVPGGLLVLWAWSVMEKEIDRVESGYLPEETLGTLQTLKRLVWAALFVILIIFIGQTILLFSGFYVVLWGTFIQSLSGSPPILP